MKAKPNIDAFRQPAKDPTAFLEDGAADRTEVRPAPSTPANLAATSADAAPVATKPEPTVQKLFRLRWDVANALKMGAAHASVAAGKRVTETEIVEQLIRKQFKI